MHTQPLAAIPDLLALAATFPHAFPALLKTGGRDTGWDILLALPSHTRCYDAADEADFMVDFAALPVGDGHAERVLPFTGGWFFYLGYEALMPCEPSVPKALPDAFPLAALMRIPAAILVNRATQTATLVAEQPAQLAALQGYLAAPLAWQPQPLAVATLREDPPNDFTAAAERIKRYIYEGDVFQVNLSRQWHVTLRTPPAPADVFAALHHANPAPFSALVQLGAASIVSSSPERLVRVEAGWADTRPIAGTHPRSPDPAEDAALRQRLIASAKERAEHIMLIDLERNDLGRIAESGTVEVNELMTVASYTYVHHIESNVRCIKRRKVSPAQVFRALFPGGTITGCPKVRTLQIIRELETAPRRAYTGSVGYLNHDGTLDSNILIRTFMLEGDSLRFRAGAGIVADSDPSRELQETRHKARGLLRALGIDTP